jgi:adenosylcobyric acid synthase
VLGGGLFSGLKGVEVSGYEIHMGQTEAAGAASPMRVIETHGGKCDYPDGAADAAGNIFGSYIHGLFHNAALIDGLLANLRKRKGLTPPAAAAETADPYDALAAHVRASLDMKAVYGIAGLR